MACGSCAARRAALAAQQVQYVWTADVPVDGSSPETMTYDKEIQAKAKVMRKGGSYVAVSKG